MAGKQSDNLIVERVASFGYVDVEFLPEKGKARICTFDRMESTRSPVLMDSFGIEDLIGALRRVQKKVRKAES